MDYDHYRMVRKILFTVPSAMSHNEIFTAISSVVVGFIGERDGTACRIRAASRSCLDEAVPALRSDSESSMPSLVSSESSMPSSEDDTESSDDDMPLFVSSEHAAELNHERLARVMP